MNRRILILAAIWSSLSLFFWAAPVQAQEWIELRNAKTGLCLDTNGGWTGTLFSVDECNNGSSQKYLYRGENIVVQLKTMPWGDNCLSALPVTGDDQLKLYNVTYPFNVILHPNVCDGQPGQAWILESDGRLRNVEYNACLTGGATRRDQVSLSNCESPAAERAKMVWSTGVKNDKWVRLDKVRTIAVSSGINDVALTVAWAAGVVAQEVAAHGIDAALAAVGLPIPIGDTVMSVVAISANLGLGVANVKLDGDLGDLSTATEAGLKGLDSIFSGPDDLYITARVGGGKKDKIWPSGRSSVDAKPGDVFTILVNRPLEKDVEFTLFDRDTFSDDDLGGLKVPADAAPGTYVATIGREDEDAVYQLTYTVYFGR